MVPQTLLVIKAVFSFSLKYALMREENRTNSKHQVVPVTIKVMPRQRKGSNPYVLDGAINWGKNDRKKRATFGFKTFVINP